MSVLPTAPPYAVVIPTIGRPCLGECLAALAEAAANGPPPERIVIVDDRPAGHRRYGRVGEGLPLHRLGELVDRAVVVVTGGRGPAAARNLGRRAVTEPWIAFLDDDVRVEPSWARDLAADLDGAGSMVAGVQGRLRVPLPTDRAPTDWERNTAGLETSAWVTADMAYRAEAFDRVGGMDERFRRAYREDADLALRLLDDGWTLERGRRRTVHPVRPTDRWVSIRMQAGNDADALMRRLHGPGWRTRAQAPAGRRLRHLVTAAAGLATVLLVGARRPRAAALTGAVWSAGTGEFAWARIRPGPRTRDEVVTMLATSAVVPFAASWHWLRGIVRHRGAMPHPLPPRTAAELPPRTPDTGGTPAPRDIPDALARSDHPQVGSMM